MAHKTACVDLFTKILTKQFFQLFQCQTGIYFFKYNIIIRTILSCLTLYVTTMPAPQINTAAHQLTGDNKALMQALKYVTRTEKKELTS